MTEYTNRTHPIFLGTTNLNSVNLGITTKCSMKCPKCSIDIPGILSRGEAEHASVEDIFRDSKYMRPMRRVHITGGEPTIHPQFNYIANAAREFFDATFLTLESNGANILRHKKVVSEVFDLVFITYYRSHAVYEGNPDNTLVIEQMAEILGPKLVREPPVVHVQSHLRIKPSGPLLGEIQPCSKWFNPGLPCGWYNGKLYPCCVTFGIDKNLGIPVTPDWREKIGNIPMGCDQCCFWGT